MSNYDDDALVPPGAARVPRRPGVTLVSVPAVPAVPPPPKPGPSSASPSAPTAGPPQSGGPPSGTADMHSVQPQPTDTTDTVVAPPGVKVPSRPGIAIVQPAAPPLPPLNNVPQVTGPGVQGGGGGGSRTNAAAPNDGILSVMLRADNGTSLSNPPLQPPSKAIGGNPVSNRSGAPAAIDNHITDGNIHFALVGQPNKLGQVKVQVHVDLNVGAWGGDVQIQVGGKVVPLQPLNVLQNTYTVSAFPGQTIRVLAGQTSQRNDVGPSEEGGEPEEKTEATHSGPGGGLVIGTLPQSTPAASDADVKITAESSVDSARAKVVQANGLISLKKG